VAALFDFVRHHDERRRRHLEGQIEKHQKTLGNRRLSADEYVKAASQLEIHQRALGQMLSETEEEKKERYEEINAMMREMNDLEHLDFEATGI
jgi:septal ring factor EnvC (AmiA/AmiB activator)